MNDVTMGKIPAQQHGVFLNLVLTALLGWVFTVQADDIGSDSTSGSDNAAIIEQVYQAFRVGDMETILSFMADDVVWVHPGPDTIPFAGTFQGKQGVQQFFTTALERLEVLDQKIYDFLVKGDTAAVYGFEHMRVKATGREYKSNWIHSYSLRDGRIARFEEYIDTAAVAAGFAP